MQRLERILIAAKNTLVRTKTREPHCYSSWIRGEGYIGTPQNNPDHYRQLEQDIQSEIDNLGYAPAYAEKGYEKPKNGILFADWNKFPQNFDKVLERAGYAVEWSDEWTTCADCNKAIRTEPDSYCYTPFYKLYEGEIVCLNCLKEANLV